MAEGDRTAASGTAAEPLLAISGLTKRFTATLALDRVDFDLRRGEVHALLGQNGAGQVDAHQDPRRRLRGRCRRDPLRRPARAIRRAEKLPIAFIHQDLGLVEWMTVAENVALLTGYPRSRLGLISWRQVRKAAADALADHGERPRSRRARDRAPGGRALARRDRPGARASRPTSSSSTSRRRRFPRPMSSGCSQTLRRLRASGIGIVYVTHRLDEVFRIADRITVLRDGRRVATVDAQARRRRAISSEMIVGRSMSDAFVRPAPATERVVLDVEGRGRPGMSGRCRSPSRRARRSGSSACAAPGITRSAARFSARCRSRPATSSLDGEPRRSRRSGRRDAEARSASSRAGAQRRASPPTWRCARTST